MLFDDAVTDAQAKPGPVPDRLGGKKRFENAIQILSRNTQAVVFNFHIHRAIGRVSANPDIPLTLDGVKRVGQKIHEHLTQLAGISLNSGNIPILAMNFHAILVLIAQQVQRNVQGGMEIDLGHGISIHAGKGAEI